MPSTSEQWLTFWIALAVTAVVISLDVFFHWQARQSTFSQVFARLSDVYVSLLLAFVFWLGVLIGHLLRFPR